MTSQARAAFETEVWKIIPNHESYSASSFGNIKNNKTEKILMPVVWGNRGHMAVKVGGGRGASKKYIHRLVLMSFIGMPEKGQIACHRNDVKTDNRLENLYWGTYKSNTADAIRNGKFFFVAGIKKFEDDVIKKILLEYTGKRGEQSALARKYGMSISNVHLIVHGYSRIS